MMEKIKTLRELSPLSQRLLRHGHELIIGFLAAILTYFAFRVRDGGALNVYLVRESSELMVRSVLTGLAVVWGGALFIDYAGKREGKL